METKTESEGIRIPQPYHTVESSFFIRCTAVGLLQPLVQPLLSHLLVVVHLLACKTANEWTDRIRCGKTHDANLVLYRYSATDRTISTLIYDLTHTHTHTHTHGQLTGAAVRRQVSPQHYHQLQDVLELPEGGLVTCWGRGWEEGGAGHVREGIEQGRAHDRGTVRCQRWRRNLEFRLFQL